MPSSRMGSSLPTRRASRREGFWLPCRVMTLLALLVSTNAPAQTGCEGPVTVSPPNPTSQTAVTLSFVGLYEICSTLTYEVVGNDIVVVNEEICGFEPLLEERELLIGVLPPGTYDVRVVRRADGLDPPLACGTFTVTAAAVVAPIPALSPLLLIGLAIGMATVGLLTIKRVL